MKYQEINGIADDSELLEIGRKAVEDTLVDWRDNRLSMFNRHNGLVIREKDGKDSSIIRLGTEDALRIGLRAMAQHMDIKARQEKVKEDLAEVLSFSHEDIGWEDMTEHSKAGYRKEALIILSFLSSSNAMLVDKEAELPKALNSNGDAFTEEAVKQDMRHAGYELTYPLEEK